MQKLGSSGRRDTATNGPLARRGTRPRQQPRGPAGGTGRRLCLSLLETENSEAREPVEQQLPRVHVRWAEVH